MARLVSLARLFSIVAAFSAASHATAETVQVEGQGVAVTRVDRSATFDDLGPFDPLDAYAEDGLSITVPGRHYDMGTSGMIPPMFFPNGGAHRAIRIATADGRLIGALEFNESASSLIPYRSVGYWETRTRGVRSGSGIFNVPNGQVLGFVDAKGFDELLVMAYLIPEAVGTLAAAGFDDVGTVDFRFPCTDIVICGPVEFAVARNDLAIDNVRAMVDLDSDGVVQDNCTDVANPDQSDRDGDSIGDVCDPLPDRANAFEDQDLDGEENATDRCSDTPPGSEIDSDGCSLLQFCSSVEVATPAGSASCTSSDWKNDEPLMKESDRDCAVGGRRHRPGGVCVPAEGA